MNTQRILLVEDNPADAQLTLDAFRRTAPHVKIEVCEDGESALDMLLDPAVPLPQLVLLDLNLPGISGREVLQALRNDERTATLPVCILSTSRAEDDIVRAYLAHTNCYVVKPVDLSEFRAAVERIEQFWFRTAVLPTRRLPSPT